MTEFTEKLGILGLESYADQFIAEGFDSWETLCEIQESDLSDLGVKLGHRRKLQKAVNESLRATDGNAVPRDTNMPDAEANICLSQSQSSPPRSHGVKPGQVLRQKRRYRRHPKPDNNAPERPTTAYVLFSNHMRDELKDQSLSFTEIAKAVGERWQVLPSHLRDSYEKEAATCKERYNLLMAEYKKGSDYNQYQQYLADFKSKNDTARGKKPRLQAEASTSTTSSRDSVDGLSPTISTSSLASPSLSSKSLNQSVAGSPPHHSAPRFSSYDGMRRRNGSHVTSGFAPAIFVSGSMSSSSTLTSTLPPPNPFQYVPTLPPISKDPMVALAHGDGTESPGRGGMQQMSIRGEDRSKLTLPTLPSLGLHSTSSTDPRPGTYGPVQDGGPGSKSLAALLRAGELARDSYRRPRV